jgi:hypothetical protein
MNAWVDLELILLKNKQLIKQFKNKLIEREREREN